MPISIDTQARKFSNALVVEYERQFSERFLRSAKHIDSSLQTVINRKIDNSLKEMPSYGLFGREITPPIFSTLKNRPQPWQDLSFEYRKAKKKGRNRFFLLSGDLKATLLAIPEPRKALGGFSMNQKDKQFVLPNGYHLVSDTKARKDGPTAGRPKLVKNMRLKLRFSVMAKMDAAIRQRRERHIFDGLAGEAIGVKLTVNSTTANLHRDLLASYYRFYAQTVLPNTLKSWLRKQK